MLKPMLRKNILKAQILMPRLEIVVVLVNIISMLAVLKT
jgi:hypothetical protein